MDRHKYTLTLSNLHGHDRGRRPPLPTGWSFGPALEQERRKGPVVDSVPALDGAAWEPGGRA